MSDLGDFFNGGRTLRSLPIAARLMLTMFLMMIGSGYLMALGNLYYRFEFADGKPGLSLDDFRAHFHGLDVAAETAPRASGATGGVAKSRMLEMVEPGRKMHRYLAKGGDPAIRSLIGWLKAGAQRDTFETAGTSADPDDPSPSRVILKQCLRCHNVDSGEKQDTPYGPDLFTVDYDMVYKFAAPGTGKGVALATAGSTAEGAPAEHVPAQALDQLFLVAHIHMLSMPVFTLIVGGLFLMSGRKCTTRGAIAVLPMAAMFIDFASWWLARESLLFVHVTNVMGAVFGLFLAVQMIAVLGALWFDPPRRTSAPAGR
ncbi:MAG TPA: hypothetical protein VGM03_06685 [Phycisphaerae bacterium]|jgi:hypothetical protein